MDDVFQTIEDVAEKIKVSLVESKDNKKSVMLLYAFSSTGKTRISRLLSDEEKYNTVGEIISYVSERFKELKSSNSI